MYFGSVKFFKHLIITALILLIAIPIALCVWFGINNSMLKAEIDELYYKVEKTSYMIELYGGTMTPNADDAYKFIKYNDIKDEEILNIIRKNNPDAFSLFVTTPAQTSETDKDPATEPSDVSSNEETLEALSETSDNSVDSTKEEETISLYADLCEDMYVDAPTEYVNNKGSVYLTFDDGPSRNTYSVLDYLAQYNAKATFFVIPEKTDECYTLMQQIVQSGHSIGVHSASHDYDFIYSSVENWLSDFYEAWNMIYEATGVKTQIFRFPGGSKNDYNTETYEAIIKEMTRRGFRYYDWNVDSEDSAGATWTDMYYSVPDAVEACIENNKRAVILMHDFPNAYNTVLVIGDLLNVFAEKGWKMDAIKDNDEPIQFVSPRDIEY